MVLTFQSATNGIRAVGATNTKQPVTDENDVRTLDITDVTPTRCWQDDSNDSRKSDSQETFWTEACISNLWFY